MSRCAVFRSERMYMYGYRVFWYQDASGQRHCRGFRAKRDFASDVTVLNSTSIVSVVYPPCVSRQLESAIWGDFTVAFILVLIVKSSLYRNDRQPYGSLLT
jgi:hypothetical protein